MIFTSIYYLLTFLKFAQKEVAVRGRELVVVREWELAGAGELELAAVQE
jgi:hypothetical protein